MLSALVTVRACMMARMQSSHIWSAMLIYRQSCPQTDTVLSSMTHNCSIGIMFQDVH